MVGKDFTIPTESQMARDAELIDEIASRYLGPLWEELAAAVPGYFSLGEWERYKALMQMECEHPAYGHPLYLDFGRLPNAGWRMHGWAFPGTAVSLAERINADGVVVRSPLYHDSEAGVADAGPGCGSAADYLEGRREHYNAAPLPFKVALIALHIRENVLTDRRSSCRLAAGFEQCVDFHRFIARPLLSEHNQRFGWRVALRDPMPENEMGLEMARAMRALANKDLADEAGWISTGTGVIPTYAEHSPGRKQIRSEHDTTVNMRDFFLRVLPSRGLHVGRKGEGRRVSFEDAFAMFDELHPGQYCDSRSFTNRYYQMKGKWEEES